MADGAMTASVARVLAAELEPHGFDVLFDHGDPATDPPDRLGTLKSWIPPRYAARTILADLDIAVVARETDQLLALVEVEETTAKPKTLLGDVLATLLGSHVTFKRKRRLRVGEWTRFIVMARCTNPALHSRIAFLEKHANHLKTALTTPNAAIGEVFIRGFRNEPELAQTLRRLIQPILAGISSSTEI